jgi:hypothetical protein
MNSVKHLILFSFLLSCLIACQGKSPCDGFVTASDLDKTDLKSCKADTNYFFMKKFSLAYNTIRARADIPELPADFEAVTWTVKNQVRWVNAAMHRQLEKDTAFRQAFMDRKDLEWDRGLLIYDRTNYRAMDSLDSWLTIEYFLDTVSKKVDYRFNCSYMNKYDVYPKALMLNREQADSVLESWKLKD